MSNAPKILIVDDDESTCELLQMMLQRQGCEAVTETSARAALNRIANEDFSVVLTDLDMAEIGGIELCQRIAGVRADLPVIVVTGMGSLENAIAAMRAGAFDFVTKPVDPALLSISVNRAAQHRELREEVRRLQESASKVKLDGIIGDGPAMERVFDLVARVAEGDASVLISGETGTGKEVVAKAIHQGSGRKGNFVAVNCAAIPPHLLESELFGHARGAFTDAKAQRTGLFALADGGTLFLDEIAEMPLEMQPKLLRALQERTIRPVGANTEVPFDARIITASNRDLESEVYEKRFREDLYYRINVVKIALPPLRERGMDIVRLAEHFLNTFAIRGNKGALTLSEAATEKLLAYNWPGNVRQLENCMERAVALARLNQIAVDDLPENVRAYTAERFVVAVDEMAEVVSMDELERRYIHRVLALVEGNKSRAAQLLGFDRRTMYRKLERYHAQSQSQPQQPSAREYEAPKRARESLTRAS
ncbi:MAG TPA: sigma-54 dependent transcriptional regulator [Polyangiaceae bacterium]|jgi:DNA-binding NtrC family response regulator|nr:sigma-54 dependent transcriptional regulator [Polyangiaceae bacterium]